jgi:RNA polymerase sigma-70 factor, ECF subfamily
MGVKTAKSPRPTRREPFLLLPALRSRSHEAPPSDLVARRCASPRRAGTIGFDLMSHSGPTLRLVKVAAEASPPSEVGDLSLEALYEEYAAYVGALASRLLGRVTEVEDIVQDVFSLALTGLLRREEVHEVKGWLAKVTVRRCIRQLRFRRLWAFIDGAVDPSYQRLVDPGAGPEERHLVREVYRALDRLPSGERVAWTLRHVEGERLEDVAVLCDCSLATAKRRIASAHRKIKVRLEGKER